MDDPVLHPHGDMAPPNLSVDFRVPPRVTYRPGIKGAVAKSICLTAVQRYQAMAIAERPETSAVVRRRAKALLLMADGATNLEIARRLHASKPNVSAWRWRFLAMDPILALPLQRRMPPLRLTEAERESLERVAADPSAARLAKLQARAAILLADGFNCAAVARKLEVSGTAVRLWRRRFAAVPESDRIVVLTRTVPFKLGARERARLEAIAVEPKRPKAAIHARAMLLLAQGRTTAEVAAALDRSVGVILVWRRRYERVCKTGGRRPFILEHEERQQLKVLADGRNTVKARRAKALLLLADGENQGDVARLVGATAAAVSLWMRQVRSAGPARAANGLRRFVPLTLTDDERAKLVRAAGSSRLRRQRLRAEGLLLAADGVPSSEIRQRLGVSAQTVTNWRAWFQTNGIPSAET